MPDGLDKRSRDEDGRIREKNGATKIRNLVDKYPELEVFSPDATLSGIRTRYGVQSIDEVRQVARQKRS